MFTVHMSVYDAIFWGLLIIAFVGFVLYLTGIVIWGCITDFISKHKKKKEDKDVSSV